MEITTTPRGQLGENLLLHKIGDLTFTISAGIIRRVNSAWMPEVPGMPTVLEQVLSPEDLTSEGSLIHPDLMVFTLLAKITTFVSMVFCKDQNEIAILAIGKHDQYYIIIVDIMFTVVAKPVRMFTSSPLDNVVISPGCFIIESYVMEKKYSVSSTGFSDITTIIRDINSEIFDGGRSRCVAISTTNKVIMTAKGVFYVVTNDTTMIIFEDSYSTQSDCIVLTYMC